MVGPPFLSWAEGPTEVLRGMVQSLSSGYQVDNARCGRQPYSVRYRGISKNQKMLKAKPRFSRWKKK